MNCVAFATLVHALLESRLPLNRVDTATLVDLVRQVHADSFYYPFSSGAVLTLVEQAAAKSPLDRSILERLQLWRERIQAGAKIFPADREVLKRLLPLLSTEHDPGILAGEAWSDAALSDLKSMQGSTWSAWLALLKHCSAAHVRPIVRLIPRMKPVEYVASGVSNNAVCSMVRRNSPPRMGSNVFAMPRPNLRSTFAQPEARATVTRRTARREKLLRIGFDSLPAD